MGRGITRLAAALATAGLVLFVSAGSASASFHEMKVREISAGTGPADSSYVEIQMYAPGQEFLHLGAQVVVCNATCTSPATFGSFSDVANGATQSTVVFGDGGFAGASKDFNVDLNLNSVATGGAFCYLSEPGFADCVSWGNFTGNSTLMGNYGTSAGTPAAALSSGMALRRSIAAGCATALEPTDDTDNSAADFAVTTPNPRRNSVTPTETTCGTIGPTGYPPQPNAPSSAKKKKTCKKRKKSSAGGGAPTGGGSPAYSAKKKTCKKK
jgi:hypothetical protein